MLLNKFKMFHTYMIAYGHAPYSVTMLKILLLDGPSFLEQYYFATKLI